MGGACSTHTEQKVKAYKIFRKPGGNGLLGTNISRSEDMNVFVP